MTDTTPTLSPRTTEPSPYDSGTQLRRLVGYFLRLGTIGFGGPVALVGYMRRDLVDQRKWVSEDTYSLSLALAQIMPGPLAAQLAVALGYFESGVLGATLVAFAFVLPSFLMVLALSSIYVQFHGLWWMEAFFYGVGAAVVAIIAIAAYKLADKTNKHDPLLWGIFAVLFLITVIFQAELFQAFIAAGLLTTLVKAPPLWLKERVGFLSLGPWVLLLPAASRSMHDDAHTLWTILLFFTKAGAFVFGSGLAIVPFLYQGVVHQYGWLNEQQFRDAVAVAMITPGPVVITTAFTGYLVAGWKGAVLASIGTFLPMYLLTVGPAPWFKRHRENPQLKAFVQGATAAATGAITGAVVILGEHAIVDIPTALIALGSLAVLWRYKVPEPVLVMVAAVIGLVTWSGLHGVG